MAKKAKAKSGALIYLVLDRSGSMAPIADATIDGCNLFLDETRQADPEALFSLLLFDHEMTRVHKAVPLQQAEKIDRHVYQIRGNTALLDAVGTAISDIDQMVNKPEKIVVCVMTDGMENSSHEYTRAAVKALVSKHETEDKWQFLFLGANLDSFAEAGAIGMARSMSSVNWQPTASGTQAAYAVASASTGDYLRGMTSTLDVSQASYNSTLTSIENSGSASMSEPSLQQRLSAYKQQKNSATPAK